MLFNSFFFILVFLPVCVAGYFCLNRIHEKAAQFFLFAMSLWFYGYYRPSYLPIILASIAVNYLISRVMMRMTAGTKKKLGLAAGILFNICLIGYYKYLGFFTWNINAVLHTDFVIQNIVMPLGISFYTIQQISYLVDAYRGETTEYGLLEYALYVSYFPQLVAGPIVLHKELIPQFRDPANRKPVSENILHGAMWFTVGLAKKVLLADLFATAVDWGFEHSDTISMADTWVVMLAFTFQLYFDFSGYSDMACGIAKLFNFTLPQNFDSPYKKASFNGFWDTWHLTLTRFMTTYVYFPLGGSRKGRLRTVINIMIVFLVSGLWHGANYTYILWGLIEGVCTLINRRFKAVGEKIPFVVCWIVNFFIRNVVLLLFRSTGVKQWIMLIKRLFTPDGAGFSPELLSGFRSGNYAVLYFVAAFVICLFLPNNYVRKFRKTPATVAAYAALLVWCLFTLNRVSVFLYFNF